MVSVAELPERAQQAQRHEQVLRRLQALWSVYMLAVQDRDVHLASAGDSDYARLLGEGGYTYSEASALFQGRCDSAWQEYASLLTLNLPQ